jgi:transposase-like protein
MTSLFGYRLQLLDYTGRTTVSEACRTFGVHRSTFYRWKRLVDRHGLEARISRPSFAHSRTSSERRSDA